MENGINWLPMIVAAFIPLVLGAIYYGPLFGKPWMASLGFTEEDLQGANMPLIYGVALVLAFLLAMGINFNIELSHKECSDAGDVIYGSFHTFKHGALHGFFTCLFLAIPVLVTNSLFQRNSWKNILINAGYWFIAFSLMGGLVDAWN
ncbi:MAG: DUF1761 domain-containing protein [Saprospiraceae bacterium]|nr:DUF1761 domain-containing protein [Saprospiraceae bacterium]